MTTQEIVDNVRKSSDRRMPPESHGPASAPGASSDWIVNCQIKKLY